MRGQDKAHTQAQSLLAFTGMDAAEASDESGVQPWSDRLRKQGSATPNASSHLARAKDLFDVFEPDPDEEAVSLAVPTMAMQFDLVASDQEIPKLEQDDHVTSLPLASPPQAVQSWADVPEEDADFSAFRFGYQPGIYEFEAIADVTTAGVRSHELRTQCGPFLAHARATLPDVCQNSDASEAFSDDNDVPLVSCPEPPLQAPEKGFEKDCSTLDVSTSPSSGTQQTPCTTDTDSLDNVVPFVTCPEPPRPAPVKGFEKECSTRNVSTSPSSGTQLTPCTTADQHGRLKDPSCTQQTPCTSFGGYASLGSHPGGCTQQTPCTDTRDRFKDYTSLASHLSSSTQQTPCTADDLPGIMYDATLGCLKVFPTLGSHPGSCTQLTLCTDALGRVLDYTSLGGHLGSSTQQTPCTASLASCPEPLHQAPLKGFEKDCSTPDVSTSPSSCTQQTPCTTDTDPLDNVVPLVSCPEPLPPAPEKGFEKECSTPDVSTSPSSGTQPTPRTAADQPGRLIDPSCTQYTPCTSLGGFASLGSHPGSCTQQTPCTDTPGRFKAADLPGLTNAATHVPGEALDFDGFTIFDLDGDGRLKDFDSQSHGIGTQCGPLPQHLLESQPFGPLPQSQSSGFPTSRTQCGLLPQQHSPRTSCATLDDTLAGMKNTLAQLVTTASVRTSHDDRLALLEKYAAATRQFELWDQAQYSSLASMTEPPAHGSEKEQAQYAPLASEPPARGSEEEQAQQAPLVLGPTASQLAADKR